MNELVECPFCGSDDLTHGDGFIFCNSCRACGPEKGFLTEFNDPVVGWNTRVFPKWLREKIESRLNNQDKILHNAQICDYRWVLSITPDFD